MKFASVLRPQKTKQQKMGWSVQLLIESPSVHPSGTLACTDTVDMQSSDRLRNGSCPPREL
jgi:hypothetical protein